MPTITGIAPSSLAEVSMTLSATRLMVFMMLPPKHSILVLQLKASVHTTYSRPLLTSQQIQQRQLKKCLILMRALATTSFTSAMLPKIRLTLRRLDKVLWGSTKSILCNSTRQFVPTLFLRAYFRMNFNLSLNR